MKSYETRRAFLDYFEKNQHRIVPSSPVVPVDDPTLLFTNAGMVQFKNVFLGLEKTDFKRAASSQKCIRAGGKHNDLDNVGFTVRHQTFFEMLGNFSFGDYFKEEAIYFAWEFVTKILGFDPGRLYATVYTEDNEAEKLWKRIAPQLGDRVLRFGEKDNFWAMGDTGPCGPCSEIHYDRGQHIPGELNGEGDRFMEIWNLVFMQSNRDENGNMTPLPEPSVDTGAGLERFCMIMQNADSNYGTDLFKPLIDKVCELSGKPYSSESKGIPHRVIADHVRALSFAIADNASISNEGRGYVLRRILRRAARYGHQIGLTEPFLYKIVQPLVENMSGVYPELKDQRGHIELVIKTEEEQFDRTLDIGIARFEDIVSKVNASGGKVIPGEDVFKLYDTYGFPADLTEIMAHEKGFEIDWDGFNKELEKQRERSKDFRYAKNDLIELIKFRNSIGDKNSIKIITSKFVGYDQEKILTKILDWGTADDWEYISLFETPFYSEAGGQVSDIGHIYNNLFDAKVEMVEKAPNGEIYHFCKLVKGVQPVEETIVTAEIDSARRADIKRNHTATHLLHKALKLVLGEHVNQSGSLVAPDHLRFDFSHFKAMTPDEIDEVEEIVKAKIKENLKVYTPENDDSLKNLTFEEARKMGAVALFGEKYGDTVRVVKTGDFTIELCGGTHVSHTADIGQFFITSESAIAAGMRRIEAITGTAAKRFIEEQKQLSAKLINYLKNSVEELDNKAIIEIKNLKSLIHTRILARSQDPSGENLGYHLEVYLEKIKKLEKEKARTIKRGIFKKAAEIKPDLNIKTSKGGLLVYVTNTKSAKDFMDYFDSYKNIHKDETIVVCSRINGQFAINSPDHDFANEIKNCLTEKVGGKGGGKPTIRGAMPPDKVEMVIKAIKKKFSL